MSKIKLGILTGGNSIEREVSKLSCENVLNCLDYDKYDVWVKEVDVNKKDWIETLIKNPPDIILSTLHGGRGENGSMQGLLHYLNIPYTGSKVLASSMCMDKKVAKKILNACHIPTIQDIYIKRNENIDIFEESLKRLGYPLIIKPNRGGSSIGIKICRNFDDVKSGAEVIVNKYDDDILIEKYIEGREISCCILESVEGREACIIDIDNKGEIFAYEDKYKNKTQAKLSAIPSYMQDMIKALALKTFDELKCKGYAIVDMMVKEEQVYVIEVNTLPGLTSTSLIPKTAELLNMSFGEFLDKLIEFELNK
ncbi:MAG: D-alanine--D-alanine ligase [Lachnospirales bacterium]